MILKINLDGYCERHCAVYKLKSVKFPEFRWSFVLENQSKNILLLTVMDGASK